MQAPRGRLHIVPTHSWPRRYMGLGVSVTSQPRFTHRKRPPLPIG